MIYLVLTLLILLLISYVTNKSEYIAPSFVFSASFLFSSIWAFAFEDEWNLCLHLNTYLTISMSVATFVFVCALVNFFCGNRSNSHRHMECSLLPIYIEKWKLFLMLTIEISTVFLTIISIFRLTGTTDISKALYLFDNNSKYATNKYEIPKLIGWLKTASLAAGYWFIPVFSTNLICRQKNKFPILEGMIVFFSMLNYLTTGGRQGTVNMALGFGACYILMLHKYRNREYKKLEKKFIAKALIIFVFFLLSFKYMAGLLGRNNNFNFWEYLALYCGAPIKNFDTFLQENIRNTRFIGADTFYKAYEILWKFLREEIPQYTSYSVYRRFNGFELGNVYTMFKNYIYDFDYLGNFILVIIFAVISQYIFIRAKNYIPKRKPNVYVIIYCWIFNALVLSF